MAGGLARGTGLEDVPARSGAAGDDPEAGWRRASARHSDHSGSGGSDRRQDRAGADLRGGLRGQCLRLSPARGAVDAVKEVHRLICRGYTDVVDADLSQYFDTIPHRELMQVSGPAHRGSARAAAHQDVAEGADRGAGWRRDPAHEWRQGQHARHAARRRREPAARQHLHEPVPEALASDADAAKRSVRMSSPMPTTSSSSAAVVRPRRWRGRRR